MDNKMRLLWCMVMVAVVSGAAVIQDLVDESTEDDGNTDAFWRSLPVDAASDEIEDDDRQAKSMNLVSVPLTYHIPSSVHVQPLSYHVPGSVYNVPSPLSAPPKTPASTVLLPMLRQPYVANGIARSEGEVISASARGNAWDTCFWLFEACTGIDIPAEIGAQIENLFPSTYGALPGVTPGYLRYGYGVPVGPSVQYPVHVGPQAGVPVPTTYGAHFWCGIFTWKCLPDISGLPVNIQNIIRNGLVPAVIG